MRLSTRAAVGCLSAIFLVLAGPVGCGGGGGGDDAAVVPTDTNNRPDSPMGSATFTMTPATQAFGDIILGQSSSAITFTVTNTGTAQSGAVNASIGGSNAGDFMLGANTCSGMRLMPMGTCTISVTYSPAGTTPHASTGSLTATDGTASAMSGLTGNAIRDVGLSVSPTPYNFGATSVGTPTAAHTFTVTNTGGAVSGMLTMTLTGLDSTQFTIANDMCTGHTLAAAATCTIDVTYAPTSAGDHAGSLSATGSPGGTASASLVGRATIPPAIRLVPATRNFGSVVQGATSTTVDFTLSNTGGSPTANVAVTLGGANASEFTVTSDLCSGGPLAGGANCVISVQFTAGAPGAKTATLNVAAGTLMASSTLTATSVAPGGISITPSSHDFGNSTIGTATGATTFTVTNTGGAAVGPMVVAVAGTNPADFPIVAGSNACSGAMLAGGASCTVAVQFNPSATGARDATLTANGAGATAAGSAALTGAGDSPALIQVTPAAASFGSVATGTTLDLPFTVTNAGTASTGAITAVLTGLGATQFSIVSVGTCSAPLAGGASCTITVRFAPTATGMVTAVLDVSSPTGGSDTADIGGTGITPAALVFGAGNPVTFNNVAETDTPTRTVTVQNTGAATVTALTVAISGANASSFTILPASTCGATLAGMASCTVVIQINAHAQGALAASLDVSGTPGGMISAPISATGIPDLDVTCTGGLDFGSNPVGGTPVVRQCRVTNNSTRALTLSALPVVTGADFAYTAGGGVPTCAAGTTLTASTGFCQFRVTLTPTGTAGARTATVAVAGTPGGAMDSVTLTATVLAPLRFVDWRVGGAGARTAFATPTATVAGTAAYGDRAIGQSYDVEMRLQNFAAGNVTTPQTSSMFTGDLNIVQDTCSGSTIASGALCSVFVRFYPRATGAASGTVSVTTVGANVSTANVTANGIIGASVGVTGTANFGTVVATRTADQTFTITNASPSVGTGNISYSLSGSGRYSIVVGAGGGTCPASGTAPLAASGSCTVVVRFSPLQSDTIAVAVAATLTVQQGVQTVNTALTAQISSQITLSPATRSYTTGVGATTASQSFTVTNVGATMTGAITANVVGAGAPGEWPITNNCATLAPLATCTIDLAYGPATVNRVGVQVQVSNGAFLATRANSAFSTVSGTAQNPATLTISPSLPVFLGFVAKGTNSDSFTFTIRNTGDLPSGALASSILPTFIMGGAGCAGGPPAATTSSFYDILPASTCSGALAAGASCTVVVRASPPIGGAQCRVDANFQVTDGTMLGTATGQLQMGTLDPATIFVTPTVVDFGSIVNGQQSTVQRFTVTNGSAGSLTLATGGLSNDPAHFTVVASTCAAGQVIPPAGSCTFDVRFNPPAGDPAGYIQTLIGVLTTTSINAVGSAAGTRLLPAGLSVTPGTSNFGNVVAGQTSAQTITVSNTGGVPTAAAPAITLGGADPSQFSIANNLCTAALAPAGTGAAASCTFDLVFAPTGAGARSATLTINAGGGATHSRTATGTGIGAALLGISPSAPQACPGTADFAGTGAFASFACTTYTISNGGGSATSVTTSITGDFAIDPTSTCVTAPNLGVGATCTVIVRHTPSDVGADTGTLTVSAPSGVASVTGNITGTGVAALTAAGTTTFGSAMVGNLASMQTFTFTNQTDPSTGVLTYTVTGSGASDFDVIADSCSGVTLARAATCTTTVRFIPSATGTRTATLTVTDGTGNKTAVVNMSGTGT